jgi:hypothetical protein
VQKLKINFGTISAMSDDMAMISPVKTEIKTENGNPEQTPAVKEEKKCEGIADEDSSSNSTSQLKQRVTLTDEQKSKLDPEILALWTEQNTFIDYLEGQFSDKDGKKSLSLKIEMF